MIDVKLIGAPAFSVAVAGDRFVYTGVNAPMGEIAGLAPESMIGRTPDECLPPEIARAVVARYRSCVAARHAIDSEVFHDRGDGGRWWHTTVTPVFDALGAVTTLVGVATDITDRRRAERDRREIEARMALAMDVLDGGFWHLDVKTGALEVSAKLAMMVAGRADESWTWAEFTAALHPDDRAAADPSALARGECETHTFEYRVLRGSAEPRWFRSRRRLIRDASGAPERVIGVAVDITEQKRIQAVFEGQAVTDPLTGLRNRRGFEASAERFLAARRAKPFGLVLLDLDRFKPVNDRHGHATGDAVLRELAARFRSQVRGGDVVARIGGDEFAILVEDTDEGALSHLARRLILAARRPIPTPAGALSVGISVGIATSLESDASIDDLAVRADRALYEVKLSGRGTWRFVA